MKELAQGHMVSGSGAIWSWVWLETKRRGMARPFHRLQWYRLGLKLEEVPRWRRESSLNRNKNLGTWPPTLAQQGHLRQTPRTSPGGQMTYLSARTPPYPTGDPQSGPGAYNHVWEHPCLPKRPCLHPQIPSTPAFKKSGCESERGRRGRGRTKPQHKKTGAHFSPNSPWEGTHCSHGCWVPRQSHVHPGEMQGSHWKAALSLELTSVHSCDVQRVLKGRVSILQTDPQKIMLPAPLSQPHQQNVPWKRGLLPTKLGSNPGAKYYSDAVLNQPVAIPSHSWQ